MPANRKPTAVHEASGSFTKHPDRARDRANEPKPISPLGPMPDDFLRDTPESKKHRDAWEQIVAMAPPGVLTLSDTIHVELTARAMVISRRPNATSTDRKDLARFLAEIGCTPVGRTRIHVEHGARLSREAVAGAPQGWAALDEERSTQGGLTN